MGSSATKLVDTIRSGDKIRAANLIGPCNKNINVKSENGMSCLTAACHNKLEDIALQLLKYGNCEYNYRDRIFGTALKYSVRYNLKKVFDILIRKPDINVSEGLPLYDALILGRTKMAVAMIKTGKCNLSLFSRENKTPLMIACMKNQVDVCTELLNHSCHIHSKDREGKTALYYAYVSEIGFVIDALSNNVVDHYLIQHIKDIKEQRELLEYDDDVSIYTEPAIENPPEIYDSIDTGYNVNYSKDTSIFIESPTFEQPVQPSTSELPILEIPEETPYKEQMMYSAI